MSVYDLTFGVELECFMPAGATRADAAAAVAARLGRPCNVQSYNHQVSRDWKVVQDGSLGDYQRGVEFVSPILKGEDGLAQLDKVCDALVDFGCEVNKRCGFHVHVGAAGQGIAFWRKALTVYRVFENVIDGFMPISRRGSSNTYCRTVGAISAQTVAAATSVGALSLALRHSTGAADNRYHKVNLESFARHSTIEFRQHSGTLDARKARNWTLTCLRLVETAKNPATLGSVVSTEPTNNARPGSKYRIAGDMMMRAGGATRTEICRELGWPSLSLPHVARACGLDVTTQRTGREVRYFVRRAETAAAVDVSLEGFCTLLGSSESEREYLRLRTSNLRGSVAWAA